MVSELNNLINSTMDGIGGGIRVGGSAKDREAAEMMQLLELSKDALGTGKLPLVEPAQWKNVSMQIQSSIKILKE